VVLSHREMIHKGSVAELFAGLEFRANAPPFSRPQLHYWHREAKSSKAEVDYILQRGKRVLPVEVKSGSHGRMKSLKIFMEERGLQTGVRLSEENAGRCGSIVVLPLYAAGNLTAYRTDMPDPLQDA